jgi:hypothetical protein
MPDELVAEVAAHQNPPSGIAWPESHVPTVAEIHDLRQTVPRRT